MDRIVQAREPFSCSINGVPVIVSGGDLYYGQDPVVQGREHLFDDLTVLSTTGPRGKATATGSAAGDSETASAAPGTRRRMTRNTPEVATPKADASPTSSEV